MYFTNVGPKLSKHEMLLVVITSLSHPKKTEVKTKMEIKFENMLFIRTSTEFVLK